MEKIVISTDFSRTPGSRSRSDGPDSGEDFFDKLLKPKFKRALELSGLLFVDLDGAAGYATSFLDASFGELAREFNPEKVRSHLTYQCKDEPLIEDEIREIIG